MSAFDESRLEDGLTRVLLIRKNRPSWQAGLLNGLGGHVEEGETQTRAMVREFEEECGLRVGADRWNEFARLACAEGQWVVHFFRAFGIPILDARAMTDEPLEVWHCHLVPNLPTVPNLRWLIPLAAQPEVGPASGEGPVLLLDGSGVEG